MVNETLLIILKVVTVIVVTIVYVFCFIREDTSCGRVALLVSYAVVLLLLFFIR